MGVQNNMSKDNAPKMQENLGSKAFKAGVWYTVSNVATKAILVLTTPIFTRMMSVNDYGITATFTSWYTLLSTFCTLNLTYSIGRAKIDFKDQLNEYVGNMQLISLVISALIAAFGLIFVDPVSKLLELSPTLTRILAIYLVAAPTIALYQAKFKYLYKYKGNILITLYTTVFSVSVSLMLVFNMSEQKYLGRIIGIVVPTVLLSLGLWINSIRIKSLKFNPEFVRYGLGISLPLVLNSVSLNILAQSDRIVITKSCGTELTAVYTIAYQLAILVSLVYDSIGQAWLPWFHDSYALGNFSGIKNNLKSLILFGCYIGFGCMCIAPEAIAILGGDQYKQGQWVVAPIVLGLVCKFIYGNYEHIELHLKKTTYIGVGTVIAACLNLILNLIFVPKFGFVAAGYTTFFSYFVLMLVHYFITKYILHVDIYEHSFMFASVLVETVIAVLLQLIYPYIAVRYLFLAVITVGIYMKYKNILLNLIRQKA